MAAAARFSRCTAETVDSVPQSRPKEMLPSPAHECRGVSLALHRATDCLRAIGDSVLCGICARNHRVQGAVLVDSRSIQWKMGPDAYDCRSHVRADEAVELFKRFYARSNDRGVAVRLDLPSLPHTIPPTLVCSLIAWCVHCASLGELVLRAATCPGRFATAACSTSFQAAKGKSVRRPGRSHVG